MNRVITGAAVIVIAAGALGAGPANAQPATQISGDGTYLVGKDIQPGTYVSAGSNDGCYWARLSGLSGDLSDIIANSASAGQQYVTIGPNDVAFRTSYCGVWRPVSATAAAPQSVSQPASSLDLGPGRAADLSHSFSYAIPSGWSPADASQLSYGSALLNKGNDTETSILLGVLDLKLFAAAETDNTKAAQRLASDMGEFFMPFPGNRINQQTTPLRGGGVASYYEVRFQDTSKPNGQIWAGVEPIGNRRFFVVWVGTNDNPVDMPAASALAESIRV